jgi:hypothetical protein
MDEFELADILVLVYLMSHTTGDINYDDIEEAYHKAGHLIYKIKDYDEYQKAIKDA